MMTGRVRQDVDNIVDSSITQVAGDQNNHYYGITVADAKEISRDVVKQELALFTAQAIDVAEERLKTIVEKTIDRTQTIDPELLNRFGEPAIQFALKETYGEYMKTGDVELGEQLIDLLIDRLEVDDRTTMQFLVDEARKTLPKLSKQNLSFLALAVFARLTIPFILRKGYKEFIQKLPPIINDIISISVMDTMYLHQIGCVTGMSMIQVQNPLESTLSNSYKYFFSHGCSQETLNKCLAEHTAITSRFFLKDTDITFGQSAVATTAMLFWQFIDFNDPAEIRLSMPSERNLSEMLQRYNLQETRPFFDSLVTILTPYSDQEIIDYHVAINSAWKDIFALWKRGDISYLQITPVGLYIGSKYLERITGMQKIPQEIFYQ